MAQDIAYPLRVLNLPSIGRAEKLGISMASDTTRLTRAIVAGDEAAFGEFYDRYSGRLYGFLLVLTCGEEDVARDVHQMVMVKVARKFRVIATEAELWAWLAQVARNAFVDHVMIQPDTAREVPLGVSVNPQPSERSDMPTLTDEELIASFPANSCFLAEVGGRQILVFVDPRVEEKMLGKGMAAFARNP